MVRVILGDVIEILVVIRVIRIGIMTGHIWTPCPQINIQPCAGLLKEDSNPHRARLGLGVFQVSLCECNAR